MASGRRFRLLHLSDLHARGAREAEGWRRRRVLGEAWQDNLDALLQDGGFDLVCFTGDAADWGQAGEFAEAGELLGELLARVELPAERLFVVPGNHDVDRSIQPDAWRAVRDAAWSADPIALARWLDGGPTPPGFESTWRAEIFGRLAAYRSWVRDDLGRGALVESDGPLAYRQTLDHRGVPIHVVGLDSAWLCGGDDDNGNLRVTDQQVMRHLTDERGAPLDGFRLVLMHHPLDDLADTDRADVRRCLAEHADLVLRGHLHSTEISTWADPDRQVRQLAAGCLYDTARADHYANACQVVTLDLDSTGRPEHAEVRMRVFSPRGGHWHDDPSLYRDATDGRLSWTFPAPRPATGAYAPNPFQPYDPVVPPRFHGRQAALRRLDASLGEGHGVSIVGDWRIGKSSLLATWGERLRAAGRTVRLVDGQGRDGESVAAFVSAVVGRPAPEATEAAADALGRWARAEPAGLEPVLLIDELDGVVRRFDPRFFERLREMLGQLVVVTASRRPVDTLYDELGWTSPFHNRLRVLHLGLLDRREANAIVAAGDGTLDAEDRELLRRWAGRHPFHLQLLGHCLAEARRFGEPRADALDRYRDGAEQRLSELWRQLDERDRDALRAALDGTPVTRRGLRRRGLVTDEGEPFGEVLREWLREEA